MKTKFICLFFLATSVTPQSQIGNYLLIKPSSSNKLLLKGNNSYVEAKSRNSALGLIAMKKSILILYTIVFFATMLNAQCSVSVCSDLSGEKYNYKNWYLENEATVKIATQAPSGNWHEGSGVVINNFTNDGTVYILSSYHTFDENEDRALSNLEKSYIEGTTRVIYNMHCGFGSLPGSFERIGGIEIVAGSGTFADDYIVLKQTLNSSEKTKIFYAGVSAQWDDLRRNGQGLSLHHSHGKAKRVTAFNSPLQHYPGIGYLFNETEIIHGDNISEGASGGGNFRHYGHYVIGINHSRTSTCDASIISAIHDFKDNSTDGLNTFNNVILNGKNRIPSRLPHNFKYESGTVADNLQMTLANDVTLIIQSSGVTGTFKGGRILYEPWNGVPSTFSPVNTSTPSILQGGGYAKSQHISNDEKYESPKHELHRQYEFSVIPNPNKGEFCIHMKSEENYDVTVTDVTGKVIYSNTSYLNKTPINMINHVNGVYFVTTTKNNQKTTKKLVKM